MKSICSLFAVVALVESSVQSGPVWYAPSGPVVVGAYQDDDEFHRMRGALQEIRVFQRALTREEISARYGTRLAEFPVPTPEPLRLALTYGPFIDWLDRTTARVTWETDTEMPSRLELFSPDGTIARFGAETPVRRHEVRTGLGRDSEYRFRVRAPDLEGREHATRRYLFDTSFFYQPVAVPAPVPGAEPARTEAATIARQLLERGGVRQGWGVVLGARDGQVALELVRQSDLKLVIVEANEARVQATRAPRLWHDVRRSPCAILPALFPRNVGSRDQRAHPVRGDPRRLLARIDSRRRNAARAREQRRLLLHPRDPDERGLRAQRNRAALSLAFGTVFVPESIPQSH
jgi:hypothetical protein